MNDGQVLQPFDRMDVTFGGACRSSRAGCSFRRGSKRHTCPETPRARWQCFASRLAETIVDVAAQRGNPDMIPEDVNYNETAGYLVDVFVDSHRGALNRLMNNGRVKLKHTDFKRITVDSKHIIGRYMYDVARFLRDLIVTFANDNPQHPVDTNAVLHLFKNRDTTNLLRVIEGIRMPPEQMEKLARLIELWARLVVPHIREHGAQDLNITQLAYAIQQLNGNNA